ACRMSGPAPARVASQLLLFRVGRRMGECLDLLQVLVGVGPLVDPCDAFVGDDQPVGLHRVLLPSCKRCGAAATAMPKPSGHLRMGSDRGPAEPRRHDAAKRTGPVGRIEWSGRRVSNSRPQAWEAGALPTELHPRRSIVAPTPARTATAGRVEWPAGSHEGAGRTGCRTRTDTRMRLAYLSHPSSLEHEMGDGHPECPDRVRVIADRLLASGLLDLMIQGDAPAASREQLLRAHAAMHVNRIEASAPLRGHVRLDPDTVMNPATLNAARHAAGAVVRAVDMVLDRECERAFCNVR